MTDLLGALARGEPRALAALLVVVSLLLHVAGSNLAWHYRAWPGSTLSGRIRQLAQSGYAVWAFELLRLAYYVGLPYAALYLGWVDVRAMGLGYLDWADGLRWTIVLTLAAWSLLMFVWVPYLRATRDVRPQIAPETIGWARRAIEVVYMQAHWAFYRAASILILSTLWQDDLAFYRGTLAGIGLVLVETWADPRVRRLVAHVGRGEMALWSAGQLIVNTVGFVLTRNVWLLALIHLVLEFSVPHLRPIAQPAPPRAAPTRARTISGR